MDHQFYNEDFDFEELIREKSDQVKMYPSDRVWNGIQRTLHGYRKWYRYSLVMALAGFSYFSFFLNNEAPKPQLADVNKKKETVSTVASSNGNSSTGKLVSMRSTKPTLKSSTASIKSTESTIGQPISSATGSAFAADQPPLETALTAAATNENNTIPAVEKDWNGDDQSITNVADQMKDSAETSTSLSSVEPRDDQAQLDRLKINWLQENAAYNLAVAPKKKMSWQFAVSPTMNYRKLVGNDNARLPSDVRIVPLALTVEGGLKNLVKHNPAVGFEASSMMVFAVNSQFRFKSGFQFNYSKYNIQAYSTYSPDRATIALGSSAWGGVSPNAISTYSNIGNFGGSSEAALKNEYYQISMPFGVEWSFIGKRRLQMGIGTTLQPTYLLNRDSYLITTDYKNYTKQPSLVSRWNLNAGLEAFLSYETSGYKVQLGPQFRYQLFSTYTNKYPIHEYLMEYGIKLAFSKTVH